MPPRTQEDPRFAPHPARRPRRQPRSRRREDQVTHQLPTRDDRPVEDRVTRTRFSESTATAPESSVDRQPTPIVMPGWRHVATLAAPNIVATFSFLLALIVATMTSASSMLFVVPLVVPSVVLGAFNRSSVGQGWRAAVAVNLSTMLVLFPLLVIRQSTVRVPYLDDAHGTVFAAVVSTIGVLAALVGLALYTAWASRQDPESAPLLFLPAALLVPLLTSATEFARLESALPVAGLIFAIATALTVVASMLPPAYTVFVAPIAVAFEVLFVTVVRQDRIFPVGVGEAGMTLFASVVVAAIVLVVMLPAMSTWMQQVDVMRMRQLEGAT
jgi:hypothetical protein